MKSNPIQFAVVREDPDLEIELIKRFNLNNCLLIGSGGCSAFSLKTEFPNLKVLVVDPNPHQMALIKKKLAILSNKNFQNRLTQYLTASDSSLLDENDFTQLKIFNIEDSASSGLNACGNFESLFRQLRLFLNEFVLSHEGWVNFLSTESISKEFMNKVFDNKYWNVAFEMFFSDSLLNAMFTASATQHATLGSYPNYFRKALERGLLRNDRCQNPFLHHILLGYYLPRSLPNYLKKIASNLDIDLQCSNFQDVTQLKEFDFIHLSNITDWMTDVEVKKVCEKIKSETDSGTVVLIRQLNNTAPIEKHLENDFISYPEIGRELLALDKSLFYSNIIVLQRK
jgi:S-adenosylmethionine-diacylglycerol 3-amino-3-carboxypropyl transferase